MVVLGEFDPFYVANVTCTSNAANTFLYELQCQNLTIHNRTVEQSEDIQLTPDGRAYPISEQYVVKWSELQLHFNFVPKRNADQECILLKYMYLIHLPPTSIFLTTE